MAIKSSSVVNNVRHFIKAASIQNLVTQSPVSPSSFSVSWVVSHHLASRRLGITMEIESTVLYRVNKYTFLLLQIGRVHMLRS